MSSMPSPLVTIIVSSFNKVRFLPQTIESIMGQTYTNWELIISDDASTDGSQEIINNYVKKDKKVRFFQNGSNRGANFCRNQGLNNASGEYIIFMDADDLLSADCLFNRVHFMEQHPSIDAAIFTMQIFNKTMGDMSRTWEPQSQNALKRFLSHDLPWQIMQPIWRKRFLETTGGFDELFPRLQDVEFHTRILLKHEMQFDAVNGSPDCYFRTGEDRKVFDATSFLTRWVDGATRYYNKFFAATKEKRMDGYLAGTLHHTYLQIIYQYKTGKISRETFMHLEQKLFAPEIASTLPSLKKIIFKAAKKYNMLPLRVPGINYILHKLVIN